ncbi:MAG: cation transporter [Cardiobacteriaceae bacterium]|nr:cation transporter [Cardiobacteriaceae bacterium]
MTFTSNQASIRRKAELAKLARKSVWISVLVNIFLSILQMTVGIFAHSAALVADGIHSLSDLISDLVAIAAAHLSQKAPDADHNYGHRRYENAASLLLGIILIATALAMIFASIEKFAHHQQIRTVHFSALFVALIAICCKELLFRYMLNAAKRAKSGLLIANAWHARSDAAASVVALCGIVGNMLGFAIFDALAALIVGTVIAKVGFKFAFDALQDLIDAAADAETIDKISKIAASQNGVLGFHDLRTRKTGSDVFVDIHIEVNRNLTVVEGHDIAVAVRRNLLELDNIADVLVHIDPAEDTSASAIQKPQKKNSHRRKKHKGVSKNSSF